MGRKCTIKGCPSKSIDPEHRGVTYHSFPLDPMIRQTWIKNCQLDIGKNITKNTLVCSRHFRRIDFQPNPTKANKFFLKTGTYPTIFPWGRIETADTEFKTQKENELNKMETIESLTSQKTNFETQLKRTSQEASEDLLPNKIQKIDSTEIEITTPMALNVIAGVQPISQQLESPSVSQTNDILNSFTSDITPLFQRQQQRKVSESTTGFTAGAKIEAQDFNGIWHSARIVEVDNDEGEVLIRFEKSKKGKGNPASGGGTTGNRVEEWIPQNSSRLRHISPSSIKKPPPVFEVGEKCMAKWTGARKFPATVTKIIGNDMYEVLFDDGYIKNVKNYHMSKIRHKGGVNIASSASIETSISTFQTTSSDKQEKRNKEPKTKKDWPLISMSSLNLGELNLPEIPQDGEWCCYWVNDQPIGQEGFLMVGDHKKPTVIVEDWRLPPNWVKHMYQRSNVLGKWDVILVNPQGKRFRSKADLKQYLEELGQVYNPDIYDFSIHRRRAKDIGAYKHTKDYKPPPPPQSSAQQYFAAVAAAEKQQQNQQTVDEKYLDDANTSVALSDVSGFSSSALSVADQSFTSEKDISGISLDYSLLKDQNSLDDGYVNIGSLKVQIIDNLFRCPEQSCNKNFRKEDHLQIHIKHYHRDLAKLLGECPNMQELARKRTSGTIVDEPLPKNHLPNIQFFAKLHQQDLANKTHRKSNTTPTPFSTQNLTSLENIGGTQIHDVASSETNIVSGVKIEDLKLQISSPTKEQKQILEKTYTDVKQENSSFTQVTFIESQPSIDEQSLPSLILQQTEQLQEKTKKQKQNLKMVPPKVKRRYTRHSPRKTHFGATRRKNIRRKIPRKSKLLAVPTGLVSDLEETRHSFGGTTITPATAESTAKYGVKKLKSESFNTLAPPQNDTNFDGNSQSQTGTVSSAQENYSSQSPKYINENGEMIKIVRMRQEEIINCLCNYGEEDGLMIQCDLCLCWQHGICNGIENQSQVPDKYVCYICRNPQRGRSSLKYIHDQDWMYEGKLPVATYHAPSPDLEERFEILRKTHILTGNLLELKKFMHSLKVKINISENKDHPKMYLWAKKWESSPQKSSLLDDKMKINDNKDELKSELQKQKINQPTIPQPEAPIDPTECQHRLLEHIRHQQSCVMDRLQVIESQVLELESLDNSEISLEDSADYSKTKDMIAMYIKDLETMKNIAKLNSEQLQQEQYY